MQGCRKGIQVGAGIVEGQGWPHRALESETPQDGLRAVMAGANRNAILIECLADLGGRVAIEDE